MATRLDTTFAVRTPERVQFELRTAGPGTRALAWGIDLALRLTLIGAIVFAVLLGSSAMGVPGAGQGTALVLLFLSEWGWAALLETIFDGRTPGKRVLGLRVVRDDGSPAGAVEHVLRNLLRAADILPIGYAVAVLSMAWDGRLRRLGDRVSGCVVIHEERTRLVAGQHIDPPITDEERRGLPTGVALTRAERTAIEAWLRRLPYLSAARAEELAGLLATPLSERTGVRSPTAARTLALAWARATGRDT